MSDDETITDRRKSEKLASAHAGRRILFIPVFRPPIRVGIL